MRDRPLLLTAACRCCRGLSLTAGCSILLWLWLTSPSNAHRASLHLVKGGLVRSSMEAILAQVASAHELLVERAYGSVASTPSLRGSSSRQARGGAGSPLRSHFKRLLWLEIWRGHVVFGEEQTRGGAVSTVNLRYEP